MRKYYWFLLLLTCSLPAWAQQTIFNVPSSDITPASKVLAQQQFEVNSAQFRSTTTVDYGVGKNWEVGLNIYNLDYLPAEHSWLRNDTTTQMAYAPLLLVNAQKTWDLTNSLHLGIGGQTGLNLFPLQKSRWEGWGYLNLAGSFKDDHYKTVAGFYAGNHRYLGEGPTLGGHIGIDAGVWYEKLHLLGDWASGSHEYGQLMLGAEVYLQKHLPLAIGWRRSNADGEQAIVLQLTYTPK